MIYVFPRMTKCTFHKFGTSGNIEKHDALCILPLNIVNEKIYIFIWFWLLLLGKKNELKKAHNLRNMSTIKEGDLILESFSHWLKISKKNAKSLSWASFLFDDSAQDCDLVPFLDTWAKVKHCQRKNLHFQLVLVRNELNQGDSRGDPDSNQNSFLLQHAEILLKVWCLKFAKTATKLLPGFLP